jgi:hypothetical protein
MTHQKNGVVCDQVSSCSPLHSSSHSTPFPSSPSEASEDVSRQNEKFLSYLSFLIKKFEASNLLLLPSNATGWIDGLIRIHIATTRLRPPTSLPTCLTHLPMLSHWSRSVPRRRQLPLILSSCAATLVRVSPSLSLLLQWNHRPHKSHDNNNSSTRLASSLASFPSALLIATAHLNPLHSGRIQTTNATTKTTTTRRNMSFHFGSSEYAATFVDLPRPDTKALRNGALEYLKEFNPQSWYEDPVRGRSRLSCPLSERMFVVDFVSMDNSVHGTRGKAYAISQDSLTPIWFSVLFVLFPLHSSTKPFQRKHSKRPNG